MGLTDEAVGEYQMACQLDDTPSLEWSLALVQTAAGLFPDAIRTVRKIYPNAYDTSGDTLPRAAWRMLYPAPFRQQVSAAAEANDLPYLLVCSVVRQESLWDPAAVSPSGAVGLMQLMPPTARWLARRLNLEPASRGNVTDPEWNTSAGCAYLKDLLDQQGDRPDLALAAYNAGPGRVKQWASRRGSPSDPDLFIESFPFWETRSYVRRILLNYLEYRRIYPELRSPRDKTYLQRVGFSWKEPDELQAPAAN